MKSYTVVHPRYGCSASKKTIICHEKQIIEEDSGDEQRVKNRGALENLPKKERQMTHQRDYPYIFHSQNHEAESF